ncbi:hypothetical protein BDV95DRAFT_500911 [Massariosphaeria phaeospora]|uniref:Uncharacterized protein n=1 Tax=Massariosphaeria phaeospora TaxID=100035 RepID=A0A7C8I978_9PLEO|nr:hypothetical protein BDV95DRAFT_500911 [Massariosphaeria phaeospora]
MSNDLSCLFPLHDVTDDHMQKLGQALWNWKLCGACYGLSSCTKPTRPWSRAKKLLKFWDLYRNTTGTYVPELYGGAPALRTLDDMLDIIRLIKIDPNTPTTQLTSVYFADRTGDPGRTPVAWDQNRAFNIAASVMFMVTCGASQQCSEILEDGHIPFPWKSDMSASSFLSQAFPMTKHPYFDTGNELSKGIDIKNLAAKYLKKKGGLRFQATNDLRDHLRLDHREGLVKVFHCTALLKESLLMSQADEEIPHVSGNIPRRLAIEAMDTMYEVLFPPDRKSQSFLSTLVSRHSFDEDFLRYESSQYRKDCEQDSSFPYFGSRLAELYDELQSPTPRGWFQPWFEKKSSARHMMMATMIRVFIAIMIGILGLGVASFQAWVAYQQWKHHMKSG